jgi:DNA transformation protein
MPVSENYLAYILEQLQGAGPVTAKKMFGGVGLYIDMVFFGLIADDVLYLKVDDSNRADYEAEGMKPFKPFGKKSYTMQYYEVPIDVMDDRDKLKQWAGKSLDIAIKKLSLRGNKKKHVRKKKKI